MNSAPVTVAIALGSNLGDRDAHLDAATQRLSRILSQLKVSSRHETEPVDVTGEQGRFLNAAAVGQTALSPIELLRALRAIEVDNGRQRPYINAPRTLDLDIILYGDQVVREPELIVPHPRFRTRSFVLEPLAEVGATLVDPVTRLTVTDLLTLLRQGSPATAQ